jgi:hypothetical protein
LTGDAELAKNKETSLKRKHLFIPLVPSVS